MESGAWVIVSAHYNHEEVWSDRGTDRQKWRSMGGSCIVSPSGEFVADPVYGEETIVYADIGPAARRATKFVWDRTPWAKDGRPDVYEFRVMRPGQVTLATASRVDDPTQDDRRRPPRPPSLPSTSPTPADPHLGLCVRHASQGNVISWRSSEPSARRSKAEFTSLRGNLDETRLSTGSRPARHMSANSGTSRCGMAEPR